MSLRCRIFGLVADTEFAIPGSLPVLSHEPTDVCIRARTVPQPEDALRSGPYGLIPEGLVFEQPAIARFLANCQGDLLVVEMLPGVHPEDMAACLVATALPMLLWQRRDLVLHGAAAVLPGATGAIAFVGATGSGKSTVLQAVLEAGGEVVAEDSVCLREEGDRYQASGLPSRLYLRSPGQKPGEDRTIVDLSTVVPTAQCGPVAPLSAIVLLEPLGSEQVTGSTALPVRLPADQALRGLLMYRHRPRIPDLLGLAPAFLPRWAAISRAIPVYTWTCPISVVENKYRAITAGLLWEELPRWMNGE